jgi:hypothetical protein
LARALTGEVTAGFTCRLAKPASSANGGVAVATALRSDFGSISLADAMASAKGWAVASWLVAKAQGLGLRSVRFDGSEWQRERGTWLPAGPADPHVVIAF